MRLGLGITGDEGRLKDAQAFAGHADALTARFHISADRKIAQTEVERVPS